MAIPDTSIAYFLKPVFQTVTDTLYLSAAPLDVDPTWYKFITPVTSLIGIAVVMFGWRINSRYARENQQKGFEEGVLDKLRIELNAYFIEYEKWLDGIYEIFEMLFSREVDRQLVMQKYEIDKSKHAENLEYLENAVKSNPTTANKAMLQNFKKGDFPSQIFWLDISEFREFLKRSTKPKLFHRFREYDLLFSHFYSVMDYFGLLHREFFTGCKMLGSQYGNEGSKPDDAKPKLNELFIKVLALRALRYQLFQFLQYECLKNMKGIQVPNFQDTGMDYISRDPKTGVLDFIKVNPENSGFYIPDQDSKSSSRSK